MILNTLELNEPLHKYINYDSLMEKLLAGGNLPKSVNRFWDQNLVIRVRIPGLVDVYARMAEQVDAAHSKCVSERSGGSSPSPGTKLNKYTIYGPIVYRLEHWTFNPAGGVRLPLGLPTKADSHRHRQQIRLSPMLCARMGNYAPAAGTDMAF